MSCPVVSRNIATAFILGLSGMFMIVFFQSLVDILVSSSFMALLTYNFNDCRKDGLLMEVVSLSPFFPGSQLSHFQLFDSAMNKLLIRSLAVPAYK